MVDEQKLVQLETVEYELDKTFYKLNKFYDGHASVTINQRHVKLDISTFYLVSCL